MDEQMMKLATERLRAFFCQADGLPQEQVRLLRQVPRGRTTTHLAFEVHPDRLHAVSAGRWTRGCDVLAAEAQRSARACAARLAPLGRRGHLATVLENAALVVITDTHADTALSPALRARLAAPWTEVVGVAPGEKRLIAA